MTARRISVAGPWITQREIDYVTDAVTNAWYENAQTYHERFERAFAEHTGVPFALALPSCTSAIHLSLLALGIGPGDEVVVPDITWTATAVPITYVGATVVFADIDKDGWCMSPASFERCITSRTRAVIPVDLYGNMADLDAIRAVAAPHGISMIEDAAEAIGGAYKGQPAGSLGDTGVFSFHGSKTLTTGEGGMLVTRSEEIYQRALFLGTLGCRPAAKTFFCEEVGQKYKMSALQAALGLAQIERVEELVDKKREIFGWYRDGLADLEGVVLNHEADETRSTYWMVTAVLNDEIGLRKEELIGSLGERGIDSRPFFYPLSSIPAYRELPQARAAERTNTVSYGLSDFGVNLPSALNLEQADVAYVVETFKQVVEAAKTRPVGGP